MSTNSPCEKKQVRRAWDTSGEKWLFASVDVIAILTGRPNPQVNWRVMKKRLTAEGNETVTKCNGLKMTAAAGKIAYPSGCHSDRFVHFGPRNGHFAVRNRHFGPRNGHFGTRNAHFGTHNAHFGPRNVHFGPRNVHFGTRNVHFAVRNDHFGMRTLPAASFS